MKSNSYHILKENEENNDQVGNPQSIDSKVNILFYLKRINYDIQVSFRSF